MDELPGDDNPGAVLYNGLIENTKHKVPNSSES
jgi:hypothetical protein